MSVSGQRGGDRVSLLICTRNRAEDLKETLFSIGRIDVPAHMNAELIVVDNASTDGGRTAAVVRECSLPNMPVRYVYEEKRGQARARNAALAASGTPLGRVLIQHDMLRRIEPTAFLRVKLSPRMASWFGSQPGTETYGRLGVIYTGDQPVVEVLEILAPIPGS